MKIPASEFLPRVNKLISENWQQIWDNCAGNKLRCIRPTVGTYLRNTTFCRRYVVIINTRITHSYLLAGGDQPECVTCQCPLTVKHILIECSDIRHSQQRWKIIWTCQYMRNVINIIKETHFYNLLWCLLSTFYCSSIALILPHFYILVLLLITYIRFYFHNNLDGTK